MSLCDQIIAGHRFTKGQQSIIGEYNDEVIHIKLVVEDDRIFLQHTFLE
jgi:hypothetical protein